MQICVSHLLTKPPLRKLLEYKWEALQQFGPTVTQLLLHFIFLIAQYMELIWFFSDFLPQNKYLFKINISKA